MNSKIITVWGADGSGKTTVATNLAAAISERNFMVGIISSKMYYGELQSRFARRVEENKGIYKAIGNGCNTKNMFVETAYPNVFFLSVPNDFDGMLLSAISGDTIKELIEDCCIRFDYIIIDGSEELNNPISSIGLTMANKIIRVYRVSAKDSIWHKAMDNMSELIHINDRAINVINAYDKSCDKMTFLKSINIKPDFEIPFVQGSNVLDNSGKLIYDSRFGNGQFKKIMQRLASQAIMGG